MNSSKSFAILFFCFAWKIERMHFSPDGYATKEEANETCPHHDIEARGGHYYCLTFQDTIINKCTELFSEHACKKYEDIAEFNKLVKAIEDNGFCDDHQNNDAKFSFPQEYEKYVALGKTIRKFEKYGPGHCDMNARKKSKETGSSD